MASIDALMEKDKKHIISDSYLLTNIFDEKEADKIFELLKSEVEFGSMSMKGGIVPRLIALQGEISEEKGIPVYRHPSDHHPKMNKWSPTVEHIKNEVEKNVKLKINHMLIQQYRNGDDFISEHSDKTLDILRESCIVNVSFGATRTMLLRPKKDYAGSSNIRVKLPHNSIFILGWETNKCYTHSVVKDGRPDKCKSDDELSFDGVRISLTCRNIATFYKDGVLTGQGAPKIKYESKKDLSVALYHAFHTENSSSKFDWEDIYGNGFDLFNFDFT
jgi:hypothetical protein